jgi:UDP-N-acetylmuramate: L-alanyl-gamma-D-glutamyl-meso-diaminopimelate ligase
MLNNTIPKNVQSVHLIAICGTGMGALACMLKDLGLHVKGSDQNVYPPMSTFLAEKGIEVLQGYLPEHIAPKPDLVIVGNTVSKDNPQVIAMSEKGLPCCSMPQAIQHFFGHRNILLVTGTHGKTTTSSLLSWILQSARKDPSFFIGGIVQNFSSNYRIGNGPYMVVEGDEYDTAFFDKSPKFLHYKPSHTILTSIEFDHADIYRDLSHVKESFYRLIKGLSKDSLLMAYHPNINVQELIKDPPCRCETYGNIDSSWNIQSVQYEPPWTKFDVYSNKQFFHHFQTPMMGDHNLANILAVIAVASDLGIDKFDMATAIESFQGIKRRQEVRGIKKGITVMDDFAHHPTAVLETLKAVKPFYENGRIIAVFEPRTNSSRRRVFQNVYPDAFYPADIVCIRQAPLLEKIPEHERFSSQELVDMLKQKGQDAHFFETTDQIIDFVINTAQANDLIIVMSNGGFDNIHVRLLEQL